MTTETLAVRVPIEVKEKVEKIAADSHRKKSDILAAWIMERVELESWQIDETKKAIALADAEEFATEDEVLAIKHKWKI